MSEARAKYDAFIAAIDNSVARSGPSLCPLSVCVDDSAMTNASDTMIERGHKEWATDDVEFWTMALDTARLCLDDWPNYYSDLRF